ncbi:hypothetical protein ACIQJ8_33090 [Streptomyces globisporus]|uniref:hypothetical protein n=1 Tax=Streptomyces globisporus TaxID=1908 RepID=UPI003796A3CC
MSAGAASAAVLDHEVWEVVDNSVDDVTGGGSRRRLRSVPAQAGPVPKRAAGHPLSLSRDARARLGGAVRALLDADGLDGASDAVRLAVLVLASRTPWETGVVAIRTSELGRWIGASASYTASEVVPALKRSGVVSVDASEGEFRESTGLECKVLPLWAAQDVVGHPLNLTKKEYATLQRLLEAVMAPGWKHRDGRVTPAGLIGTRTGRGAATDRLALLLLVLEARETGQVRQIGGTVDSRRGRAAATVARLLGCTASAGERVLERLEDRELVLRVRLRTSSGLANRSRLMVLSVAAAHGCTVAGDIREDRAQAPEPDFSDPDVAAGPVETPRAETDLQVSGIPVTDVTGVSDPDGAAALHTDHPHLGTPVVDLSLAGGFAGEGRGGLGDLPERACVREDGGPLRGGKPKKPPVDQRVEQRTDGADDGGQLRAGGWEKAQQQKRVALPADSHLRVALRPVSPLWGRLSGWQQDQVEAAAKAEVAQLTGLDVGPESAPQLLADRLTRRLTETGGEAMVAKPFGWLRGRGLVRRPSCPDRRCDDGIRLDTGESCESCANVVHIHRARRAQMRADIDRELPGLAGGERRRILEKRLRERVATQAENFARDQEQVRVERARREAARAEAAEQAEHERRVAAAAEAVRQALACEDCGRGRAAGLCEACGYRRRTETMTVETGLLAATWAAVLDDRDDIDAVIAGVRASLEADIKHTQREFLESVEPGELDTDPVGAASVLAFAALQTVEAALSDYRSNALERLGRTAEAEAEARRAFRTEQNRRWFRHNPNGADAIAAATKAADTARERTAEYLLTTRLEQLREQTAARTEQVPVAPWTGRLHELATRPLDTDTAGAVIA